MAGGLPSADTFPIEEIKRACDTVLTNNPREALQYAASEGFAPLREWAAARVKAEVGLETTPDQVLITSGSQQGLDLVGKILCDTGAPVAVETPTYLGALQAFTPYEPQFVSLESDLEGPLPEAIRALPQTAPGTRFAYLLPNYQNPTGRVMSEARRAAVMDAAMTAGVPVVEDNPYGDLWFDEPPLKSLAARWTEGSLYLGSFSKILTPGFRLGYLIAPKTLYPKLLQAKQAADLHTPGFNQRVVYEVIKDGFLDTHIPTIRDRYKANRDAMAESLTQHLPEGCDWQMPKGGMFFWIRLPEGLNAMALLPTAVEANIAYVPGAAFYAANPDPRALRLSFVTLTPEKIREGVAILGRVLNDALNGSHAPTP
jgi:2-aminoadipate transaminase